MKLWSTAISWCNDLLTLLFWSDEYDPLTSIWWSDDLLTSGGVNYCFPILRRPGAAPAIPQYPSSSYALCQHSDHRHHRHPPPHNHHHWVQAGIRMARPIWDLCLNAFAVAFCPPPPWPPAFSSHCWRLCHTIPLSKCWGWSIKLKWCKSKSILSQQNYRQTQSEQCLKKGSS